MRKRLFIFIVAFMAGVISVHVYVSALQFTEPQKEEKQSQPLPPATTVDEKNQSTKDGTIGGAPTPNRPVAIEGTITVIKQPSVEEKADKATQQAKSTKDKAWDVLKDPTEWPNFGLLILVFFGTIFAFGIYLAAKSQAKAAWEAANIAKKEFERATRPRLHIDGVRVIDFEVNKEPVFLVKIVNSGPANAEDVGLSILVDSSLLAVRDSVVEQKIFIPSNTTQEYPIKWKGPLSDTSLEALNKGDAPLVVKGDFHEKDLEKEFYCYKYLPWDGLRPIGVPHFVLCNFDPRQDVRGKGLVRGNIDDYIKR
jgi:hypothetical protein